MYPGKLAKVRIQPDFSWLDIFFTPFVKKMYACFDPHDSWNYVGGLYDRYYEGPRILTVATRIDR
jgi:hypothetical protein